MPALLYVHIYQAGWLSEKDLLGIVIMMNFKSDLCYFIPPAQEFRHC
jgi:hypothetical protein